MPGSDELLYGSGAVSPDTSKEFRDRVNAAEEQFAASETTIHLATDEYDHPVVFWTKPTYGKIGLDVAAEAGLLHCEAGPAVVHFLPNGKEIRSWYVDGARHREDGPAIEGVPDQEDQYWLSGASLTEEEWRKQTGRA